MKRLTRNPVIRAVALLGALLLPAVRWAPPAAAQTADAVVEVKAPEDGVVLLFHAFSSIPKGARLFSMMTRTRTL